jgi:protoporphyrinogen oxidase
VAATVLEADDIVGGISRTVERDGWRFDIGGHRFFTKVAPVEAVWHEILSDDEFLQASPQEPHLLRGQVLRLPDQAVQRPAEPRASSRPSVHPVVPLGAVRPPKDQSTLEGYVVARLRVAALRALLQDLQREGVGRAGVLSSRLGAQRIKGMSLWSAVWDRSGRGCGSRATSQGQVTSLIEEFQYPKYGPGMMWERCRDLVRTRRPSPHGDRRSRASSTRTPSGSPWWSPDGADGSP